jgi:uncharacterized Tic20 family protein
MSKRALYTLIGFLLFIVGTLTLLIELVGLSFGFMSFLDIFGRLGAFIAKITLILLGFVLVALANNNENAKDEFLEN